MAETSNILTKTNTMTDLVVAEDGVWKQGQPRRVEEYTEFYFKAESLEWWVWDGTSDRKLITGILNERVPTVVKTWPPVATDDMLVGDWVFAGPYNGNANGQIARYIGKDRPDPFHYFLLYYENTDPGTPLNVPGISAFVTPAKTVRLVLRPNNSIERLSALWIYRTIGSVEKLIIIDDPSTTEYIDTDVQDGDTVVYRLVVVEGTGANQALSDKSIPAVVQIINPDLGPLVFTITEAFGRPANWKRITILNPTTSGMINYDWSIYKGDAAAGGEYVTSAQGVPSDGIFDVDLSSYPLTVSMTNLRFYLAQSQGVPPGRRQNWQPFTVSEDMLYLDPPTELVACYIPDGGYVQLFWKDNTPYETGYEIYRSTDGGGFARLNVAGVNATNYQDNNVENTPGKKYRYHVVSVKDSLSSEPSNNADVWMDMETLPAPGWIRAYQNTSGDVLMELSLNYPGLTSGITIDYDVAAHFPSGQLGDERSPWTMWARDMALTNTIISPAAPGRTWYHRIRIKKDGYVSKWSTVLKVGYSDSNPPIMNWSIMGAIQTLTKGDVFLPMRTAVYYLSGQYNPHSKFGSYRRVNRPFGIHLDTVGSWDNIPYNFIRDKQGFGWLGFTSSGPYKRSVESGDAYYEREDVPERRFWTLHQNEIEITIPDTNNYFISPNPAPIGKTFTTDAGATYTVTSDMLIIYHWDIIWAYNHRDLSGINANPAFGRLRGNMEGHNIVYGAAPGYYDILRNIAANGTGYSSAANGGTDPYFSTLTDEQFQNGEMVQAQANYNAWLASDAISKAPGVQFMLYGDGQAAFVQNGGVRLDQTFYKQTPYGRPVDLFGAHSYGWIDTLFMAVPFFIARTDKQGIDGQNIFADLCIADGWAATDTVVGGEPEFFRYSVSDAHPNGRVTVRFEDGNGNLCKTTKKYILENDYGGTGQKVEVPIGTTVISYNNAARLPNWFFNSSIDDFVDDSLVHYFWHYALFLFATRKPLAHQVYPWMISLRHQGIPNETAFTAQLPRRLVHGMNFLSQMYQVNQIWYQLQMYNDINNGQNSVGVCRTMDALIESNYWISELNMHFNRAEVTKVPEISMDGGQTWTSGTQCFRNTAYAPDHFKYVDGAYSAEWIRARRNAAQTSPLVLVSYNHFNQSWVIFEKAVFGPEITYSMRVKDKDGVYTYFNNRTVKKDWNRDIIYF